MGLESWNYLPPGSQPPDTYGERDYSEAAASGDVSTVPGNPGVTRIFYVRYEVLDDFLDDLLGYSYSVPSESPAVFRILPDKYPVYDNLYAIEATATGVGELGQTTSGIAHYTVAKVTAQYKAPDYPIKTDGQVSSELERFTTRQYAFGGEFFTINSTGMKFVSRDVVLNQPPAKVTMSMEMTYIWHMVPPNPSKSPYIPPNLGPIIGCYGRVNSTPFDPLFMNCPAGTVLFLGVEPRMTNYRITATAGTGGLIKNIFWDLAMKFVYRNNGVVSRGSGGTLLNENAGHNFLWDQGGNGSPPQGWFDLITTNGLNTGGRLYPTADLNTLWTIG